MLCVRINLRGDLRKLHSCPAQQKGFHLPNALDKLGCRPILIDSKWTCGASRPRLFWTDLEITPLEGEKVQKGSRRNELIMQQVKIPNFCDKGWKGHPDLKLPYPCICGWEARSEEPDDARGFETASEEALQRWRDDKYTAGIRFYED